MRKSHPRNPTRRWPLLVLGLVLTTGATLSGCSLSNRRESAPLATSLQELAPHGDRDHFVYVWERIADGQVVGEGIQVEHITATATAGEFEVTLSEDGTAAGRLRFRDDGQALLLLSEDDLGRGLRLSYDPPLPQLAVPLFAGSSRSATTATMVRLAGGETLGSLPVTQVIEAARGPAFHSPLGTFAHTIMLRTTRTLLSSDQNNELKAESLLVPGLGEVRSEGSTLDAPTLRRELACAIIGGHAVGNCSNLNQRWQERSHAGPSDGQ